MADDVRALERKRPRDLGEAQVVADLDADPAERRVEDGQLVARDDEAVDAEERQVRLAVLADQPVGADEDGRVVERVAVALDQPADDVGAEPSGTRRSSASVDGPGISSAYGIASSPLSNM